MDKGASLKGQPWTAAEIETLGQLFPETENAEIARIMGRPLQSVKTKAANLGMRKTTAFKRKLGRVAKLGPAAAQEEEDVFPQKDILPPTGPGYGDRIVHRIGV